MGKDIQEGDYIVVKPENQKRKFLVYVTETGKDLNTGLLAPHNRKVDIKDDESFYQFTPREVLANLGNMPDNGSVYGVPVEPYMYSNDKSHYYDIDVFGFMTDAKTNIQHIRRALKRVVPRLVKYQLPIPDRDDMIFELRPAKGNKAGKCHIDRQGFTKIELRQGLETVQYVSTLYHELAHHYEALYFTVAVKSRWVQAYLKGVKVTKITQETLQKVVDTYQESPSEAETNLDESEQQILELALGYVASTHFLTGLEIYTLACAGRASKLWPKHPLDLAKKETLLTQYSLKNSAEFFAEAFSLYFTTRGDCPKSIQILMKKTIRFLSKATPNSVKSN